MAKFDLEQSHKKIANARKRARGVIAIVWSIDDVKTLCSSLTDDEAWEVLQQAEHFHDCNHGFSWDHLTAHIEIMFPDRLIDGDGGPRDEDDELERGRDEEEAR
jgi:hypothetical protein